MLSMGEAMSIKPAGKITMILAKFGHTCVPTHVIDTGTHCSLSAVFLDP